MICVLQCHERLGVGLLLQSSSMLGRRKARMRQRGHFSCFRCYVEHHGVEIVYCNDNGKWNGATS
jgi:hypothetical protein